MILDGETMHEGLEDDPFDAAFMAMASEPSTAPVALPPIEARARRASSAAYEALDEALQHAARYPVARPLLAVGVLAALPAVGLALIVGLLLGSMRAEPPREPVTVVPAEAPAQLAQR